MKNTPLLTQNWKFIKPLTSKFPNAEVYLVGGAVRDIILKREVKDYDFVVRNIPIKDLKKILGTLGQVDLVGKRFGVIKFRHNGSDKQYDIALPRQEFSLSFSGAYRDFDIQSDHKMEIEKDLSRRDFSINAMAYNIMTDELVDPFFGQKDLHDKVIRTVGSAVTRFQEDYSRMLRALRFACQLDFTISQTTADTIKKMAHHLNDEINDNWVVAREVISQEFLKGFDANPTKAIRLSDELNILETVLPEIKALQKCEQSPPYHNEGAVFNHALIALQSIESKIFKKYFPEPIALITKLAILFHDIGKPDCMKQSDDGKIHFKKHDQIGGEIAQKICARLQLGASPYYPFKCNHLAWIVKNHLFSIYYKNNPTSPLKLEELFFSKSYPSKSLLQVMLADQLGTDASEGIDVIEPFKILHKAINKLAPDGRLPNPLLTGDDVIRLCDIKPGPEVKKILDNLREKQLLGKIKNKKEAEALMKLPVTS